MYENQARNPVTKSLAQINRLIDAAIYYTQAIEETSGRCPECGQSGRLVELKKANLQGKVKQQTESGEDYIG
jgi:hypothetical protein